METYNEEPININIYHTCIYGSWCVLISLSLFEVLSHVSFLFCEKSIQIFIEKQLGSTYNDINLSGGAPFSNMCWYLQSVVDVSLSFI